MGRERGEGGQRGEGGREVREDREVREGDKGGGREVKEEELGKEERIYGIPHNVQCSSQHTLTVPAHITFIQRKSIAFRDVQHSYKIALLFLS